jgi:pyridoxine 5-phosphate synthase
VDDSRELGAAAVELHTGSYAHATDDPRTIAALKDSAAHGASIGLAVHAGHGLTSENVGAVAAIATIEELNIGHWVVSRGIFVGLPQAVQELRSAITSARARASSP